MESPAADHVRDRHKGARPLEFERRAEGIAHGQAKQGSPIPVNAIHDHSEQSSVSAPRLPDAALQSVAPRFRIESGVPGNSLAHQRCPIQALNDHANPDT